MIAIRTNRAEYRNDIAEVIRLFCGLSDIALYDEMEPDAAELVFDLQMDRKGSRYHLLSRVAEFTDTDTFELPYRPTSLTIKKLEKRALKLSCYRLLKQLYPEVKRHGAR